MIDESLTHKPIKLMAKKARSISESSSTAAPSVRQKTPRVRNMNLAFSFNRMITSSSPCRRFAFILYAKNLFLAVVVSNLRATTCGRESEGRLAQTIKKTKIAKNGLESIFSGFLPGSSFLRGLDIRRRPYMRAKACGDLGRRAGSVAIQPQSLFMKGD